MTTDLYLHECLNPTPLTLMHEYKEYYGERWPKLVASLLQPPNYLCMFNPYSDPQEIHKLFTLIQETTVRDDIFSFPVYKSTLLNVERPFPQPIMDIRGQFTHYLLDGGSLLPVEALNLTDNLEILDLCAAPGGKSIAISYLLHHKFPNSEIRLTSNEYNSERKKSLASTMKKFTSAATKVTQRDGMNRNAFDDECFDRILLDAPCSSDRHFMRQGKSLLKSTKTLIKKQRKLLMNALHWLKNGGRFVYSTCSLNEKENDQVVSYALAKCNEFSVKIVRREFSIGEKTDLGWIVLPDKSNNYGPLYFCVLVKE